MNNSLIFDVEEEEKVYEPEEDCITSTPKQFHYYMSFWATQFDTLTEIIRSAKKNDCTTNVTMTPMFECGEGKCITVWDVYSPNANFDLRQFFQKHQLPQQQETGSPNEELWFLKAVSISDYPTFAYSQAKVVNFFETGSE